MGSQPTLLNESEIVALKGISKEVRLDHGIDLVGESFEFVAGSENLLKIEWITTPKLRTIKAIAAFDQYDQLANASSADEVISK